MPFFVSLPLLFAEEPVFQQKSIRAAHSIYTKLVDALKLADTPFVNDYPKEPPPNSIIFAYNKTYWTETCLIDLPLRVTIDEKNSSLYHLANRPLLDYLETTGKIDALATLSLEQAIQKANNYLATLNFKIPDDCQLTEIKFSKTYLECWEIRWCRYEGGYRYDDFIRSRIEGVSLVFHEKYGVVAFSNVHVSPAPEKLTVNVSRLEAIKTASKTVPYVMKNPYYLAHRKPGFAAVELKDSTLKIVTPNWLLNPERAIWRRESRPSETRLCWVIRFATVDTLGHRRLGANGKPVKHIPPDILIYIDAETGEVVGMNFS